MLTESVHGTFLSKKISKIRWHHENFADANGFITGSWFETVNDITYWTFKNNEEGVLYPCSVSSHLIVGDITELQFINTDFFVASSSDGFLKILKTEEDSYISIKEVTTYSKLHSFSPTEPASCTGFSIFEQDIASIGEDSRINLLIAQEQTPVRIIENADSCTLTCIDFLKHNEIITGNSRGHMKVWDLRSNHDKPSTTFMLSGKFKTEATRVVHHPTQRHTVVAGGGDGSLTVWDLRQDTYPISQLNAHSKAITEVMFHPDRPDNLFTCSVSGEIWHWNNAQQQKLGLDGNDAHWLNTVSSKGKVQVTSLCAPMHKPINSLDVDRKTLLFGCDNEALYVVRDVNV